VNAADGIDAIHPIDPDKRRQILDALRRVERDHDVEIVFACESAAAAGAFRRRTAITTYVSSTAIARPGT
jgi:hypothetical protein